MGCVDLERAPGQEFAARGGSITTPDVSPLCLLILTVPYFGACIHVPPPPSNQIVYVKLQKPYELKSMGDPVWITGTLATQLWTSDVADAD